jgi:hypothetical protein
MVSKAQHRVIGHYALYQHASKIYEWADVMKILLERSSLI